jgi:Ca2+-binding EF-hand superfamily protein
MILVQGTTDIIISVPLASITITEEHLRRVNMLKEGFYLLLQAIKAIEDKGTRKLAKKERTTRLLRQASTTIVAKFNHEELVEIQSDEIGRLALLTFHRIDVENQGFVSSKQFIEYLQSIDFNEMSGLQFVEQAFTLMDFDDNKTLEMKEFIAFVRVSAILGVMKDTVRTFFEFVDADGNGEVEFDELNAALSYLEQPALNDNECRILSRVSGGKDSFYVEDIVSFVTMSALKRTIDDIQESYTAA